MQPLTGYSIYDEHLERRGEGLHHVKLYYQDCKKAVAGFAPRGYSVIQSGLFNEDEHYYLDTEKDYGYVVELGNAGRIPPAERRFPTAEQHGRGEHAKGLEESEKARNHSKTAHEHSEMAHGKSQSQK
jgi:hypothetical protein